MCYAALKAASKAFFSHLPGSLVQDDLNRA